MTTKTAAKKTAVKKTITNANEKLTDSKGRKIKPLEDHKPKKAKKTLSADKIEALMATYHEGERVIGANKPVITYLIAGKSSKAYNDYLAATKKERKYHDELAAMAQFVCPTAEVTGVQVNGYRGELAFRFAEGVSKPHPGLVKADKRTTGIYIFANNPAGVELREAFNKIGDSYKKHPSARDVLRKHFGIDVSSIPVMRGHFPTAVLLGLSKRLVLSVPTSPAVSKAQIKAYRALRKEGSVMSGSFDLIADFEVPKDVKVVRQSKYIAAFEKESDKREAQLAKDAKKLEEKRKADKKKAKKEAKVKDKPAKVKKAKKEKAASTPAPLI